MSSAHKYLWSVICVGGVSVHTHEGTCILYLSVYIKRGLHRFLYKLLCKEISQRSCADSSGSVVVGALRFAGSCLTLEFCVTPQSQLLTCEVK